MNAPNITTRIADLIRNPNSAIPSEWEYSKNESNRIEQSQTSATKAPTPQKAQPIEFDTEDKLSLSPLAQKILEDSNSHESDWNKTRNESVQRVQQLVQNKQYTMTPEVIDDIAQKIVAMLP